MTLLALIAAGAGTTPGPDPDPPATESDGETYAMPTAYPWNAPDFLTTPTYDGSGATVHPDVIDFAQLGVPGGKWNGWRYWMIHTPFNNSDPSLENPSVLVSDQAATGWHVPSGVRDPLWFRPAGGLWNNDTDWTYDPDTDELVLVYKAHSDLVTARSADGVTWPTEPTAIPLTPGAGLDGASPTLVRVGSTDWRLWSTTNQKIYNRTATYQDGAPPSGLATATSTDGVNWSVGTPEPFLWRSDDTVMADRPVGWETLPPWFKWDRSHLYRATIQPHENGTHFRMWYSARGDSSWRVGYVRLPLSLWPDPPA